MLLPRERRYAALQLRRLPALLMLFALALSSLYLRKSGLPQISHIIAAAAVGLGLLTHPYLRWKQGWILGVGFVSYATFVDLVIFALYGDIHILLSPLKTHHLYSNFLHRASFVNNFRSCSGIITQYVSVGNLAPGL